MSFFHIEVNNRKIEVYTRLAVMFLEVAKDVCFDYDDSAKFREQFIKDEITKVAENYKLDTSEKLENFMIDVSVNKKQELRDTLIFNNVAKAKQFVYDEEYNKALTILNDLNKILKGDRRYCERCSKHITEEEYRTAGELCEGCCYELGCHHRANED